MEDVCLFHPNTNIIRTLGNSQGRPEGAPTQQRVPHRESESQHMVHRARGTEAQGTRNTTVSAQGAGHTGRDKHRSPGHRAHRTLAAADACVHPTSKDSWPTRRSISAAREPVTSSPRCASSARSWRTSMASNCCMWGACAMRGGACRRMALYECVRVHPRVLALGEGGVGGARECVSAGSVQSRASSGHQHGSLPADRASAAWQGLLTNGDRACLVASNRACLSTTGPACQQQGLPVNNRACQPGACQPAGPACQQLLRSERDHTASPDRAALPGGVCWLV